MTVPDFILRLRAHVGTTPLWLSGAAAAVHRERADGVREWLFVRRADDGQWSLVTGIVDPGEHPYQAAVREAAEEASVTVEAERLVWQDVTPMVTYPNGDQTQYVTNWFVCRWLSGEPFPADGENTAAAFLAEGCFPDLRPDHARAMAVVLSGRRACGFGEMPAL